MQLDMFGSFGSADESATLDAAAPVISSDGAWASPETLMLNAALKRGSLSEAIGVLSRLKTRVAHDTLLRSGFTIFESDTRAKLIAGVQTELLAAVRLRMTGMELRASRVAEWAPGQDRPPTDVRVGDTVRKDGFDYVVTGGVEGGATAVREVAQLGSGVTQTKTILLRGDEAIDAKLEAEKHQAGVVGAAWPDSADVPPAQVMVTSNIAANMKSGALVVDSAGKKYAAFSARFAYLEVHPLGDDGRPEVFAGNSVFFHLDLATAEAHPGRRHDAVYLVNPLEVAISLESAENVLLDNAISASSEKEIENDGRIERPESVLVGGGEQDRGDGIDGGIDRESLAAGLAGSGSGAVEGADVLGGAGGASGAGVGSVSERGGASAPGAARDFEVVRDQGIAASGVVATVVVEPAARQFTRAELNKLFVTDMTDEQLLQAKAIYLDGGRATAIARQMAKRAAVAAPAVVPVAGVPAAGAVEAPYQAVRGHDGLFTLENDDFVEAGNGDGSPRKFASSEAATAWAAANGVEVVAGGLVPPVVRLPAVVNDAIASEVAGQKARMMRLRTAAGVGQVTLDQKLNLQTKAQAAEVALRQMRQALFDVEDDAVRAIEAGNIGLFDQRANMFPGVQAALVEHIASLKAAALPEVKDKPADASKWWLAATSDERSDLIRLDGRADLADVYKDIAWDALSTNQQASFANRLGLPRPQAEKKPVTPQVPAPTKKLEAVPAWHTEIPEAGLPMTEAEFGPTGYRGVVPRIAKEAVDALTQVQKLGGVEFYAYVLAAHDGLNGRVRLVPDDQKGPAGWKLLDNAAYRPHMVSVDQMVARLSAQLMNSPVIGVVPEVVASISDAELSVSARRSAIAREAVKAITQEHRDAKFPLHAYVFPAQAGLDIRVRLIPAWQEKESGWTLLSNDSYRPDAVTDKDLVARLSGALARLPANFIKQESQAESPATSLSDKGAFVPQDDWRGSLLKARAYASNLGIDTKGKSVLALVDQIDFALADTIDNIDTAKINANLADPAYVAAVMDRIGADVEAQTGEAPGLTSLNMIAAKASSLQVSDEVTFTDHVSGVFHPGDVATVLLAGKTATQFVRTGGGTAWISHDRLDRNAEGSWVLSNAVGRTVEQGKGQGPALGAGFDGLGEAGGEGVGVSSLVAPVSSKRDAIATRYAAVLAEGRLGVSAVPVDFHLKFADDVIAKDAFALRWIANGLNDKSKKVFAEFTGTKLPKAQGAAWEALKAWGGVTVEQAAAVAAQGEAARALQAALANDRSAVSQAMGQKFRVSATDAAVVTGKDLVDRQIADGHTEIRNISVTRIPKYVLVNGDTNRYYPLDKVAKAYAEVALKQLGMSAQSLAVDVDSIMSVELAAEIEVEHQRELRDVAASGQTMASDADMAHLFGVTEERVAAVMGRDGVPANGQDDGKGPALGAGFDEQNVPAQVLDRVMWALWRLAEIKASLDGVEKARGNGAILASEWLEQSPKLAGPREILEKFRTMAPGNGVDADRFLKELGGEPDFGMFEAPALAVSETSVGPRLPAKQVEAPVSTTAGAALASLAGSADYVLTDDDRIGLGGLAEKFHDNLRAIQVVRTIALEKRHAVGDELRSLARYVGWGGLKGVFDPANKKWNRQHVALRALLSDVEWAAASRSQLDAHYTAPVVAKAMYSAVSRLGFESGRVLEPSVGVGNFFGLMPEAMREKSALHGVELDILTSQIVAALYPSAKIAEATGFQEYNVPAGYYDMAIGNPPFGSQAVSDDKGSAYSGWSIHNYFFAKSIDMLRPGGIMPMVVSHNFLDKLDPHVRQWIARRAELVSGVRLPNTAFKENANTEVVTDVLIFRRLDNENTLGKQEMPDWLGTTDVMIENPKTGESEAISINDYFINNPQNVLGTNSAGSSMYRANEYTVLPNGDLAEQLAQWVTTLPQGLYVPLERSVVALELAAVAAAVPEFVKEGSFYLSMGGVGKGNDKDKGPAQGAGLVGLKDGVGSDAVVGVWQRLPDQLGERRAVKWEPANQRAMERMVGMIGIRDALRGQMRLERSSEAGDAEVEAGRRFLNRVYDAFASKYGFVNDPSNRRIFLDDTESALIQALEFDYEKAITPAKAEEFDIAPRPARAVKADIFSRRVLFPPVEVEIVETAKDALLHSLNIKGRVDMAYMEGAYGKSHDEIVAELGDLLFVDPVQGLVTSDEYLSGDVKTKLAEAMKAAEGDHTLSRNVDALKLIIPVDKLPSEIHAAIGAAWIPSAVYVAFAREVSGADATFTYVGATAQWLHHVTSQADFQKNSVEYGTNKMGALEIFAQTMNSRGLEVKRKVMVDGQERYVTDEEATEAVRQRGDAMRGLWDSWLWKDGDRADNLMSIYNDRFNRTVERSYDGSHLTFPGMNPAITLLSHQKNGVWRGLQDRDMLLDQVVGAGKTFEIVAMTMEMRRLGIVKKPIIGVPNHLTLQWRSEFYRLYPGANVLAATPQDFEKDNRERFFSKIVTGNWDAVIVGHSSLKKIAVPLEAETKIIQEDIDAIAGVIKEMKSGRGDKNVVRDMEKIKANIEAKMTKIKERGGKKDNVVDFADLGVDSLFIDELHEFKNLGFTTQMNRVSGLGNPIGSGKAFDLFVKTRWLKDTYGAKAPLITATGTPISNSLAEMFTMQRYMQYEKLKANGLHVFDAWAKQYGDVQNVYEVAPSGSGYRLSQRFAKFKNLPSLMGEYRSFADVVTLDDLKAQEAALGKAFPVPKLAGGRPLNVVAVRSELQEKFFGIPEIVRTESGEIKFEIDLLYPVSIEPRDGGKFVMTQQINGYAQTSKAYASKEEAEYMTALGATTPMMTVDKNSIVGKFDNLRELTRQSKGKINALSLTGLANKAGLDYRLIDPNAIDFPDSKVNIAVRNMLAVNREWESDRGTQLAFCDLSVPLSAKAKMASKEKRVYVRDEKGALTHKKGTLHTVKDYEGLPYYLVAVGKGSEKTFSILDPVTGATMKEGLDSKQDAHKFVSNFVAKDGGQEAWLDMREMSRAIGADEIDEYKNEYGIDADGDAADLEISAQDIEGATGVSGFSIYDDMKAKLIAGGMPAAQIEFIHDHDTPQAKDLLFKRINAGDVRICFGSTPKMGAGTNVQLRIVAIHNIDAPYRPSDLEQRDGRGVRRGNMLYERDPDGFRLSLFRYATAMTYDTRRWQLLEHKAAGIEQLRNYDGASEIDDVANEASNSADMKAAASGNPLILKETQLKNEVKKLWLLERAHVDGEYSIRSRMNSKRNYAEKDGPNYLTQLQKLLVKRDAAVVLGTYEGKSLPDKEAAMEALSKIGASINMLGTEKEIVYRGLKFKFWVVEGRGEVLVRMATPDKNFVTMEKLSESGVVTRMDNWCNSIDTELTNTKKYIGLESKEAATLSLLLGKPFGRADDLTAAISEHGKVQRALMKSNSLAAVKPTEMAAFQAAVGGQKALLCAMGLGAAVAALEGEGEAEIAGRKDRGPAPGAGFDGSVAAVGKGGAVAGDAGVVVDMESYIKVAADSIAELRKTDVFRVLVESNRMVHQDAIAAYIKSARPDLVGEVDDVMEEARAEREVTAVALPAVLSRADDARLPLAVNVDNIKARMVDTLPMSVPAGAIVMNAPRPLLGSETIEGEFVSGRFYAVILPDDSMAARYVEENRKLDARVLVAVSRETRMELAMHSSGRRDEYMAAAPDPEVRFEWLAGAMAKFQDMPYGELKAAICEAMGVVKDGAYSGLVASIGDGLVTQRVNREGAVVRHDESKLSDQVAAGEVVDIRYRDGVGEVKGPAKELGVGR